MQEEIHTTVAASADREGLPVTCAIDIMDADEEGIYFLTAKGKGFYQRLKANGYIAMTGMKGKDTMSCTAVSVRGKVRELAADGCRACGTVCPQNCIDFTSMPAMIWQEHCLHCGNCLDICPQHAVIREE